MESEKQCKWIDTQIRNRLTNIGNKLTVTKGDKKKVLVAQLYPTICNPRLPWGWTVAHQASLSMGFPREEYWSGLPFPFLGDSPDPGIKPGFPTLQANSLPSEPPGKPYQRWRETSWESGINKLLNIKEKSNKDLLYSTGIIINIL